ncbi:MAG: hypothetical protein AAF226_12690, partial [Verrucomicrobiota bacterium]
PAPEKSETKEVSESESATLAGTDTDSKKPAFESKAPKPPVAGTVSVASVDSPKPPVNKSSAATPQPKSSFQVPAGVPTGKRSIRAFRPMTVAQVATPPLPSRASSAVTAPQVSVPRSSKMQRNVRAFRPL